MALLDPKAASVKIEELVDDRLIHNSITAVLSTKWAPVRCEMTAVRLQLDSISVVAVAASSIIAIKALTKLS